MPSSPTKLRGPTVTTSLEQEDVEQLRSLSVSDIDDSNDIEVISTTEADEDVPRDSRREEEQPMTKEKRLAFKQLERWRAAMKKKSKRLGRRSVRWNAKTQAYDDEEIEFDNLFGTSSTFGKELQVVSYPFPIWIFGVLIMLGASVFVHSVHQRDDEDEKPHHVTWWKYLVAVVIYILGFALIANGRVETFYMNKETSRLSVRSNKPLCLSTRYIRSVERDMRHVTNIRVETTGEYSGDVDTRTYKVHFDFDDGSHVSALESRSKQKTMRRCRHIKAFVAASSAPIAPIRSASEHFPSAMKGPGSPLRQNRTSPAKLSLE
ncbi:hypothetical protein GN244_ATG17627 [Phytophthora infestans]|uniref:Transmembrane protein n=1 Tax=Phytophthora infestans TaxID=4787 RepID=A0A833SJ11_PHYIN|nr:hypothetical protein GN244_ATG17627 [Phytophthora infestans]KAF4140020.1 hypothetical protein GN958_ATG10770 [Phytophthora infestans]KAI9985190.1 hypothetical protein PInf_004515 [Phytophthora infestans]